MTKVAESADVVVVGAGIAGLTAAAYLASARRRVKVIEKSGTAGGRARTASEKGFHWNLGPHALFLAGAGARILHELGVSFEGGRAGGSGSYALRNGRLHTLPEGFVSLLSTSLLGLREKLELAGLLAELPRTDPTRLHNQTVEQWLESRVTLPAVREFCKAMLRVVAYAPQMDQMSAGAALSQLQLAMAKGVRYIHGGWQVLVDSLRQVVAAQGGEFIMGDEARAVVHDSAVRGVELKSGRIIACHHALLAGSPQMASKLTASAIPTLRQWASIAQSVRMSSLDVALSTLPLPANRAVFGIDEPLYGSVHSSVARLAPAGAAVIHLARYGGLDGSSPQAVRQRLESLLDQFQPGWRQHLVHARFLPDLVVSHAMVTAAQGGNPGRPQTAVPGVRGLYIAGDWVGPEGMLADASFASARAAATLIIGAIESQSEAA